MSEHSTQVKDLALLSSIEMKDFLDSKNYEKIKDREEFKEIANVLESKEENKKLDDFLRKKSITFLDEVTKTCWLPFSQMSVDM